MKGDGRWKGDGTWMDAPAAHQKGPETPTCQPTLDDCSRVAAQVHWETITAAVRPAPTLRPAVLKCSEVFLVPVFFISASLTK